MVTIASRDLVPEDLVPEDDLADAMRF